MSDQDVRDVEVRDENLQQGDAEGQESGKGSVDYDTYSRLLKQRKADQARLNELNAEFNKLKAEREAELEAKMKEEQKWKELAERREKEAKELRTGWESDKQRFINTHKLNAFKEAIGGLKKPEYAKFINPDLIEIDEEGNIDEESVKRYAQEFRKDYPDLIKEVTSPKLPNRAPTAHTPAPVDLSNMSKDQLKALLGTVAKSGQ